MIRRKLSEFSRGWIIGDFEPTLLRTTQFEIAVLSHRKGETWPRHYHAIVTEYNVLLSGRMIVHGETVEKGDIFVFEPNEIADPVFLEDCTVLCVKTPSLPGDKHEIL